MKSVRIHLNKYGLNICEYMLLQENAIWETGMEFKGEIKEKINELKGYAEKTITLSGMTVLWTSYMIRTIL